MEHHTSHYGSLPGSGEVHLDTLTNHHGISVSMINYGATLASVLLPDQQGQVADVTLGYDTWEGWKNNDAYFGASIGRFGNRIAGARFALEDQIIELAGNNAPGGLPCSLHGGRQGFDKHLWERESFTTHRGTGMRYQRTSPHGEEGYPGNLQTVITYELTEENELIWEAVATTDRPTVVNLIHHSYWNLSGRPEQTMLDHELTLHADQWLPTNEGLIPTGEMRSVRDTPMDFLQPRRVGERIAVDFDALVTAGGYDHAWILKGDGSLRLAARLHHPGSGRTVEFLTNQPVIQFYSGNFLDGSTIGKGGSTYPRHGGLCLETEAYPDAPNQPAFPSTVLLPGQTYQHTLIHRFSLG